MGAPLDVSCPGAGQTESIENLHKPSKCRQDEIRKISILQINLNKAGAAQRELTLELKRENAFIALVTEPFCLRQKLSGIPKHYNTIPVERGGHPRCAIFSSPTIKLHEVTQFRSRDLVVGISNISGKKIAFISAYMDIKNVAISANLKEAIKYCKEKGYIILLGADTNSHSTRWGNEDNQRGRKWNEFIEDESLLLHLSLIHI